MKKLTIFGLFLALSSVLGCAPDFDPGSRVLSFRVLGQQADAPFAHPGETVNITSLSYDPQGRSVNWAWAACVNPDSATVQGCLDRIAADTAVSGASPVLAQGLDLSDFSYTVPTDALTSLPEQARASAVVGVVSVACPGELSFSAGTNGVPFTCKDAGTGRTLDGEEYIVGMKKIQVHEADRNQNPEIAAVLFDGKAWPETEIKTVTPCDTEKNDYKLCANESKHTLSARPTADSIESGKTEFGDSFTEQVIIDYYATEGVFEYDVKIAADPDTGWAARKAASGQDLSLWMVLHDDRGGASWTERHVHVE